MLSSDGLTELIASIVVGIGTVVAAYLTMTFGKKVSTKAEENIANALKYSPTDKIEVVPKGLAEELPLSMTSADYEILLAKVTSDLAGNPAFAQSSNQAVEALMRSYHEQALAQANAQFWFGIVAATVGFLWILVSGLYVSNLSAVPKVVPGTIMAAVAGLFLKQSRETRQRATDFYDRLHSYGRQRESLMLLTSIRDSRLQGFAQTLLALHMAGAPTGDVMTVLGKEISGSFDAELSEHRHGTEDGASH